MTYERLSIRLICLLNGDLLPLPRYGDLERNEQRIAIAVCDATEMTLDIWNTLDKISREPWMEKTIVALVGEQSANSSPPPKKEPRETTRDTCKPNLNLLADPHILQIIQDPSLSADDKLRSVARKDQRFFSWKSPALGKLLGCTQANIRQTCWWNKDRKMWNEKSRRDGEPPVFNDR